MKNHSPTTFKGIPLVPPQTLRGGQKRAHCFRQLSLEGTPHQKKRERGSLPEVLTVAESGNLSWLPWTPLPNKMGLLAGSVVKTRCFAPTRFKAKDQIPNRNKAVAMGI